MKALKGFAAIAVLTGVLFSSSGFTAPEVSTTSTSNLATYTVSASGGRLG